MQVHFCCMLKALAALGTNDTKACELLNRVRNRAHASEINTSGSELMDAIFWERCREPYR